MGANASQELVPRRPAPLRDNELYEIEIEIGKKKHSETDSDIYIVLHGTHEVSQEIEIKGDLRPRGSKKIVTSKQNNLGDLWMIEVWKKDKTLNASYWYIQKISVRRPLLSDDAKVFPAYRWILNQKEFILEGTARLPQNELGYRCMKTRAEIIEKKRGEYQWEPYGNLCSVIKADFDHLPLNEQFIEEKREDFITARNKVAAAYMLDKFFENFHHKWRTFEDFEDFFRVIPKPKLSKKWKTDEEFGRQRIQGASLTHLIKINDKVPEKFGVTTEMVKKFFRSPECTLESEAKQHRLYMLDFELLEGAEVQKGRYLCAPMCLLYVNAQEKLVPIAIQLHQKPDPVSNPIFTPADDEEDWMLAKMWVNCADINVYQVASHFAFTHLAMEPTVIAMHRNISENHPLYKLLLGIFGLAEKAYNGIHFMKLSFPEMLKARGFDPEHLEQAPPGYYFLHDGSKMWNAIQKFVKAVLQRYYIRQEDLLNDHELQGWLDEIKKVGFYNKDAVDKNVVGSYSTLGHHGLPDSVDSLDALVQIVTTIIFTCSVGHATLNFAQYESFAFIPFSPGAIFLEPPGANGTPVHKSNITMKTLFKSLPPKAIAARQIAVLFLLSSYSEQTDEMLGNYPDELFAEIEAQAEIINFREEIQRIAKDIDARGEWDRMHPKKIPNSTAI